MEIVHKSLPVFIVLLLVSVYSPTETVTAQDREVDTLFRTDVTHGGFGAPVVKFSEVRGDLGVWVGGRGGWIINLDRNHALSIGGGGYGLVTEHRAPLWDPGPDPQFGENEPDDYAMTGYGGFEMEYTYRSYQLVHLTISSLIGRGGLFLRDRDFHHVDDSPDTFFVFEPGTNLELNVTNFFRLAAGVSYRLTNGIGRGGFSDGDFSGLNGTFTLKFGKFR